MSLNLTAVMSNKNIFIQNLNVLTMFSQQLLKLGYYVTLKCDNMTECCFELGLKHSELSEGIQLSFDNTINNDDSK